MCVAQSRVYLHALISGMVSFDNTEIAFRSKSNKALKKAYWLFKMVSSPSLVNVGESLMSLALKLNIPVKWAVKPTVFKHFCGGETIAECALTTKSLDEFHIGTILDYSVEGKESDEDFERTTNEILETIKTGHNNPNIPFCVFKVSGISRHSLLEKVSAKKELNQKERMLFLELHDRVASICRSAYETGTPVFIDAEESWIQDAIDGLATKMMSLYNRETAIVYNTIQLYRHDRLEYLKGLHLEAKEGGYKLGLKLVRGAYMEKERDRAEDQGYTDPIQPNKKATDRDFDLAMIYCLENIEDIALCAGTHNEESSLLLKEQLDKSNIDKKDKRVYFAQLFGMSDHISFNLSHAGYNVAKYVPYGPVREVLPYLIRRAQENTSVAGQTSRELNLINKEIKRRKQAGEM